MNAISNFEGSKKELNGSKLYVTLFPCNECAKLVVQNGIKEVIYLEDKYKDITFIGVIDATIDLFIKSNKKNVLVIGTENTIKSNIYSDKIKKIDNNINVYSIATPNLVPLIENNLDSTDEINSILNKYKNIDSIILGCTHYKLIENLIPTSIKCIDSSIGVVNIIKKYIQDGNNCVKIYVTGNIKEFNKIAIRVIGVSGKKIYL